MKVTDSLSDKLKERNKFQTYISERGTGGDDLYNRYTSAKSPTKQCFQGIYGLPQF